MEILHFLKTRLYLYIAVFIVSVCIVYGYRPLSSNGTYRDLLTARQVRLLPGTLVADPKARHALLKQSKSISYRTSRENLSYANKTIQCSTSGQTSGHVMQQPMYSYVSGINLRSESSLVVLDLLFA